MRIISFGDLYLDYYFRNNIVCGICGGKSNANILANLSSKYNTAFFGVVGNDLQGKIAINSLSRLNVDTSQIRRINNRTKMNFINKDYYSNICPYCNRNLNYSNLLFEENDVLPYIKEDDLIIIDNLSETTINIINEVENRCFINITSLGELSYYSLDEIREGFNSRFEIINIDEHSYNVLKEKFKIDSSDLYELFNPKILIINRGVKGADILYGEIFDKKENEYSVSIVDKTGAMDAFFAEFINGYLNIDEINEKTISLVYMKSSSISNYIYGIYGSRTHLYPLYKLSNYKECICCEIESDFVE